MQLIRGAILPDINSTKYEPIFKITSAKIQNISEDPILLNVISKMCEKMFDMQINCSFQRKHKMLEQTEMDLMKFLLQITVDIKEYLKYRAPEESIDLPSGYIENAKLGWKQISENVWTYG